MKITIKNTLWGILMMSSSFGVIAQTGTIKGTVKTSDGKPAEFVTIGIKGTSNGTTVNNKGEYELKDIQPGHDTLITSFIGLETREIAVTIRAGEITVVPEIILKENSSQLNEVVVAANKKKKLNYVDTMPSQSLRLNVPLIEVPQNIQVITSQTIQDIGALSTTDIFSTVSGVTSTYSGGQDVIANLRGTDVYYNILRNGIGAGYWFNQEADAGMIDRVEFIKGPAGFMISNTDPGGLINIVTKQPTHEQITDVDFGFGSWNTMRTNIDLGGELNKTGSLTYRFNAGVQDGQSYYQFGYLKKYFADAALTYELDKNTAFTFEYNYAYGHSLDDQEYLPTINGKFFTLPDNFGLSDPNMPGIVSYDNYFRFNLQHKLNDNWSLNAQGGYISGWYGGYGMTLGYPAAVSSDNDSIYRNTYKSVYTNELYSATAFLDGSFNTGSAINHHLLAGIDYSWNRIEDVYGSSANTFGLSISNPTYYIPVDSLENFNTKQSDDISGDYYSAFYLQDHIKFFNKVILTLAGRYTNCVTYGNENSPNIQTDNKFTPRLGLTYLFTNNLSVYALYDDAFVPQVGRSFTGQQFVPLTGDNEEIGIKSLWFNKRLSINADVFDITRNNGLTPDPEHPNFQVQTGQEVDKGIEFDLNGQLTKNINVMANYAYTDARITKSNDTAQIGLYDFSSPVHNTANLFIKYRFTKGILQGFSLGAGVQYVDKRNTSESDSNVYVPAYTLFEASAGYTFGKFYINLNAYNLTNKKYAAYAYYAGASSWEYTLGEPFNFRLSCGVRL